MRAIASARWSDPPPAMGGRCASPSPAISTRTQALVGDFRGQTLTVLGAVGVALAIMSGIVARLALRPVGRLEKAIEQVREGESQTITGEYPREIAPLAEEINELMRSNIQIIERARNAVGNLAHGLKTPLAVLRNEAAGAKETPLARWCCPSPKRWGSSCTTYLDRSRITARSNVVGKKADATLVHAAAGACDGKAEFAT